MSLSKRLDQSLLNLAWSLWTELGIAGVKRNHQNVLISLEELLIFTSILSEVDPRLRDESIDWCSQFHHFISISRLKSLMIDFEELAKEPFSKYAATLNAISKTNWPIYIESHPLKINLSHKSVLRPLESPALLNMRSRAIFGTGARADLVSFFLTHSDSDFSIAQSAEIGYSKRNLAEILDDLYLGGLFSRFMQGNQQRYRLNKNDRLIAVLKPIPKHVPSWRLIFKVLLLIRDCIKRTESSSESTKVVEIRNCLDLIKENLQKLGITPPPIQTNFKFYLESFSEWLIEWASRLAEGNE